MKNFNRVLIITNVKCKFKNFFWPNVSKSTLKNSCKRSYKCYCYTCATYWDYQDFLSAWGGLAKFSSTWGSKKIARLWFTRGINTQTDTMPIYFFRLSKPQSKVITKRIGQCPRLCSGVAMNRYLLTGLLTISHHFINIDLFFHTKHLI